MLPNVYTASFPVDIPAKKVDGDEDPTLVIIPGGVPHSIYNAFDKTVKMYYYFPGQERITSDITYCFPSGQQRKPSEAGFGSG